MFIRNACYVYNKILLHLRVITQKSLQLPFFPRSPSCLCFWTDRRRIFVNVWWIFVVGAWPVPLDTLEKHHVMSVYFNLKFRVWKHNIPRASEKIIMAKVSGHISKHVNVINIIHDVNSTLHSSRLRRSKEDRVIELISKEVWRKWKGKIFNKWNWYIMWKLY